MGTYAANDRLARLQARLLGSRRWLSPLASALLLTHLVGMALSGFTHGHALVAYAATVVGLLAIPICSWEIARRIDEALHRPVWPAAAQAAGRLVAGLVLVALTPAIFSMLADLPLPALGRALELVTALLSIAVVAGLVLVGLGVADLVFELTKRFRQLATRLMFLVAVTAIGTFLWLGFLSLQARSVLMWAIAQGHLEPYVEGLAYLEQAAGTYIGGLAGALGLELPFVLLLAWRFGRNTTSSLAELHEGFARVERGELDRPVVVVGNDEVAEMQRGFNRMLAAARERQFLESAFGRYVSPVVLAHLREHQLESGSLTGERREATVMFSDIRDFTAMSARLAPEQVVALMNAYMSLMIDTIDSYDGYINKFVGDSIMVIFNAPLTQQRHALRALACAAAMQEALGKANEKQVFGQWQLQMGIGINTGPLVAGNLGNERQMEYTVLGDTVNVAARAASKAAGSQVLATGAVIVGARAQCGPSKGTVNATCLGGVELKGKGEVELYALDMTREQVSALL